jgi:23S rRNA (cytosine1962-C5)-methyltransferase
MAQNYPSRRRRIRTTPTGHQLPMPWVRLRSASAHPLIYRRMIGDVDPAAKPGDIVAVYDRKDEFFGQGFYHDQSQIALRMLTHDDSPVDDGFFRERLLRAIEWRQKLIGEEINVCRLVHAEGDGLSGLIAEKYDDVIAIEVFSVAIARRLSLFKRLFTELTGIEKFVARADERIRQLERFSIPADATTEGLSHVNVHEHGLRFRVDLEKGHKTGFFCDQRDNRFALARFCKDADVLDICCYTGGFGVYAKKLGGAKEVTSVDLDETAIAMARKNSHLNDARINHVHADAFSYLRQMKSNDRSYDVIVLDPPKFIPSRDAEEEGKRKYLDLNTLGIDVLRPGGLLLTCSCSGLVSRDDFMQTVRSAANRLKRPLQIVDVTGAAPDHPVMANCPESGYLKAIWARVM